MTRAEPGATATAARLRALGHTPLLAPLLEVRRLATPRSLPPDVRALAFTSANGVRAFAAAWGARGLPVFAVGAATAQAARSAGFADVTSADGDVAALAARLAAASPGDVILHPCARERAGDLEAQLAARGRVAVTLPLYETVEADRLPPAAAAALADGALDAVLLHSPKAARVLAARLAERRGAERARLRAIGLSAACTSPLDGLGLGAVEAACRPDEAALLERLG